MFDSRSSRCRPQTRPIAPSRALAKGVRKSFAHWQSADQQVLARLPAGNRLSSRAGRFFRARLAGRAGDGNLLSTRACDSADLAQRPEGPQFQRAATSNYYHLKFGQLRQSPLARRSSRNGIVITVRSTLPYSWPGQVALFRSKEGSSDGVDQSPRIRPWNSIRSGGRWARPEPERRDGDVARRPPARRPRRLGRGGSGSGCPVAPASSPSPAGLALLVESRPPRLRLALGLIEPMPL